MMQMYHQKDMELKDKLELLALADGFTVRKTNDDYEVECDHAELLAVITEKGHIEYYKDQCGHGNLELIDIDELLKLKVFCEALVK